MQSHGGCGFGPFPEKRHIAAGAGLPHARGHRKPAKRSTSSIITASRWGMSSSSTRGRRSNRSGYQAEVAPTIIVRMNHSPLRWSIAYSCSSDVANESEYALWLGCREHPGLSGGVAGKFHYQELAVAGAACAKLKRSSSSWWISTSAACGVRAYAAIAGIGVSAPRPQRCRRGSIIRSHTTEPTRSTSPGRFRRFRDP